MLTEEQNQVAGLAATTTQLIATGMIAGALIFSGMIATTIVWEDLVGPVKLMSTIAAATSLFFYGLAFVMPGMFPLQPEWQCPSGNQAEADRAIAEIGGLLRNQTLVRYALLEVGIFANVISAMLEARWANVVAVGLGLLLMLMFFPRRSQQLSKIESQYTDWRGNP